MYREASKAFQWRGFFGSDQQKGRDVWKKDMGSRKAVCGTLWCQPVILPSLLGQADSKGTTSSVTRVASLKPAG